ncbi:MAG: PAS domain-containing protein [Chitinophagaceae bacterium]|nr:PAS domain-containing protein [Chitinophagaceae bacterium]
MYIRNNLFKLQHELSRCSPAIILTAAYLLLSIIWVVWSDTIVAQIANNNNQLLAQLQNKKGLAFVLVSGILLFFVSHYLLLRIRKVDKQKCSLEQKIDALNIASRGGMIDYNIETKTAQINNKMRFFFPSLSDNVSDFLSQFLERIHKDERVRVRSEYDAAILSLQDVWTTEYKVLGTDNKYYTVISSVFLIRNEAGKIHRLIGEIQDVSQLRNLQAEYYNQQLKHKQRLASTIIKAEENERNRWAQELHDNISQILTVINLYLGNTKVKLDNNILMIGEARKMVNEVQQEIRLLSATMKPPAFSLMTLEQSIERLFSNISRIKKISFNFTTSELDDAKLNDEQKLMIYRVVQEQLNNIIKYAEATHVNINIYSVNDTVHIELHDDGRGFDNSKLKNGLGFRNIQSRLLIYNGHMKLESAPGKGCTLSASFHL